MQSKYTIKAIKDALSNKDVGAIQIRDKSGDNIYTTTVLDEIYILTDAVNNMEKAVELLQEVTDRFKEIVDVTDGENDSKIVYRCQAFLQDNKSGVK